MEIAGYRLLLADTAGIRASDDEIEAEGVRRARRWAEDADLRLWVIDGSASDGSWAEAREVARPGDLMVRNKADLPVGAEEVEYEVVMKASGILDAYIFHRLCYDAWVAACGSSR